MPKAKAQYRVTHSRIDYPPAKTGMPGDVLDDLPGADIGWLLEQGWIEKVEAHHEAPAKAAAAKTEDGE